MVTTTRLGLYRPIGTVSAPSSANGTTTTFKTLDANAGPFTAGVIFRLFDSGSNKKETTPFTVASTASVAGTTTITFTPAAAVSTATGDIAYIPEISNVLTAVADQSLAIDSKAFVVGCTSGTRPSSTYTGLLIYETDTGNVMRYSGAAWVYVSNKNQPRGYAGFTFTGSNSATCAANAEIGPLQSVTWTALAGRSYLITFGNSLDHSAGNDATAYERVRQALGPTVAVTDTAIGTFESDVNDNTTGGSVPQNFVCNYDAAVSGQTTVGVFLGRGNTGDAKVILMTGYQYLLVEDVGSL